jgi:hypothetical protein
MKGRSNEIDADRRALTLFGLVGVAGLVLGKQRSVLAQEAKGVEGKVCKEAESMIPGTRQWVDAYCFGALPGIDSTTAINDAIREAASFKNRDGSPADLVTYLRPGRYIITAPLRLAPGSKLVGEGGAADATTELVFQGADGKNCIEMAVANASVIHIRDLKVIDNRPVKTSGRGIFLDRVKNQVIIQNVSVFEFPQEQIFVGSQFSGQTADVVRLSDIWTSGGQYGIRCERVENQLLIENVSYSVNVNSIAGILLENMSHVAAMVNAVKIETDRVVDVVRCGPGFSASLSANALIMRGPTAFAGGDVLRVDNLAANVMGTALLSRTQGGQRVARALVNLAGKLYGNGPNDEGMAMFATGLKVEV